MDEKKVHQKTEDVELSIPLRRTRPSEPISNENCQCWSELSSKSKIFFILLILGILLLIVLSVIVYVTCGFGQNSIFCPTNLDKVSKEPTFEDLLIKPINGSVKIGDMVLDEFQFNKVAGTYIFHEPGDGVAFSGISEDKYRWPNAELPYE